jgi:DNA repair exonuclease SbcCD nuclease subunit
MLDLAAREGCSLAVAPGDMFDVPRPPARAIIEVASVFQAFEDQGIPVVGCAGNHDAGAPGQPGPVDVLATLGRSRWGITRPTVTTVAGVHVAVLPWAKPSGLVQEAGGSGDLVERTTEALIAIVRMLAAAVDPAQPAILIGHWGVTGSVVSSGQLLTGEATLPLGELQAGPWRAAVMGHIHKPQVFPGRPTVLHTGALTRRDFGEAADPRGCYVLDLETGEVEWHDLPARRFVTLDLSPFCSYADDPDVKEDVKDAIVRVVYRATEEEAQAISDEAIIRTLYELGAHHVAGVYPEIIRAGRTRAEGLTEKTSPLEALDQWLKLRGDLSEELRAEVRSAAETLMREVA